MTAAPPPELSPIMDTDEIMIQWVSNELYQYLLKNPEWMIQTYGHLKDGDKIPEDVCDVMRRVVWSIICQTPSNYMSLNHFAHPTLKPYVPIFKGAFRHSQPEWRERVSHCRK